MSEKDSIDSQPEPVRRDEWPTPPEPAETNDPTGGDEQCSAIDPREDIAATPPVSEASEPPSDGDQTTETSGPSATYDAPIVHVPADPPVPEQQRVVPFAPASTPPPALRECVRALPEAVFNALHVGRDQHNEPFLQFHGRSVVHRLRDPGTKLIIAQAFHAAGWPVRPVELQGVIDEIEGYARLYGAPQHVCVGVAPNEEGGIDHDLVDDEETIARTVPGRAYLITDGTTTLFYRAPRMLRRLWSKERGNFYLLFKYLEHLRFQDRRLVAGWVLYTMAHPKGPGIVFIHLILFGPQGSGKTVLAEMLIAIVSRSSVGVQPLPRNAVDLAIAASQGQLCAFDNIRSFPPWLSDLFCLMSTSGVITARELYTNARQSVISLHCAAILTTLHMAVTEPDLADRSLQVNVPSFDAANRRDPAVLMREFEEDLPSIYRGALELIAEILERLPHVTPANPQRVYRFSHWLAALEAVEGIPVGGYQKFYAESLGQMMLDGLHESSLNVAVLNFVDGLTARSWSGTAAELLATLNRIMGRRASSGGDWPVNEIALSRRLRASVAAFRTQGIEIRFTKSRVRLITITRVGGGDHE